MGHPLVRGRYKRTDRDRALFGNRDDKMKGFPMNRFIWWMFGFMMAGLLGFHITWAHASFLPAYAWEERYHSSDVMRASALGYVAAVFDTLDNGLDVCPKNPQSLRVTADAVDDWMAMHVDAWSDKQTPAAGVIRQALMSVYPCKRKVM
jgi:hypothetical protein